MRLTAKRVITDKLAQAGLTGLTKGELQYLCANQGVGSNGNHLRRVLKQLITAGEVEQSGKLYKYVGTMETLTS